MLGLCKGKDFEDQRSGTVWNNIIHYMSNSDADHPYHPVRVYEAMR